MAQEKIPVHRKTPQLHFPDLDTLLGQVTYGVEYPLVNIVHD